MPIVQARCTNCSASLQIDNTKDAAVCPYCGTPYVVEKAINYYNTTNHISANVVNIYGGSSADFEITGGVLKKYNGVSTDVVIPNSVTIIDKDAFMMGPSNNYKPNKGITSVYIPDTVSEIPEYTFRGCSGLKKIRWPKSWKGRIRKKILLASQAAFPKADDISSAYIECSIDSNVCLLYCGVGGYSYNYIHFIEKGLYINGINLNIKDNKCSPGEIAKRSSSLRYVKSRFEEQKYYLERMISLADIEVQSIDVVSVPNYVEKTIPVIKKDYVAEEGIIEALQITLPFLDSE